MNNLVEPEEGFCVECTRIEPFRVCSAASGRQGNPIGTDLPRRPPFHEYFNWSNNTYDKSIDLLSPRLDGVERMESFFIVLVRHSKSGKVTRWGGLGLQLTIMKLIDQQHDKERSVHSFVFLEREFQLTKK